MRIHAGWISPELPPHLRALKSTRKYLGVRKAVGTCTSATHLDPGVAKNLLERNHERLCDGDLRLGVPLELSTKLDELTLHLMRRPRRIDTCRRISVEEHSSKRGNEKHNRNPRQCGTRVSSISGCPIRPDVHGIPRSADLYTYPAHLR